MAAQIEKDKLAWWKDAIVYQIYPATFKDSTGSGTGDLQGIIDKLGYIASLGVNTIWISPFYKSPQKDLGYDIADYTAVHEPYGHVKDVETIISESKKLGMRVLADLVVNHCSDEHEWFREARKSKDSPKRDWFIWKPAKMVDGKRKEPNNWRAAFGGPTWTWDEGTQEYYYHTFLSGQPELNWENEDCREAIYKDSIKFWLDRGLAGFRVDVANCYSKDTSFPDAPITNPDTEWQMAFQYITNGPKIHEWIREMRKEALGEDAVTIGELGMAPRFEDVVKYVGKDVKELDIVIQFEIALLSHRDWSLWSTPWKLSELKYHTFESQRLADPANRAWACTYVGNHDQSRAVSRLCSDLPEYRKASAKMLATYLLTLSGTPIVYQGDEIGMINIGKERPMSEYKDCDAIGFLEEQGEVARKRGDPDLLKRAIEGVQMNGRDHARTPVQWDDSKNAGFSTAEECWMRVNDSYREGINVAEQEKDPKSVLAYHREMIKLRKDHAGIFTHGKYIVEASEAKEESVFIFTKECRDSGKKAVVVLNWSKEVQKYNLPKGADGLKVALDSGDAGAEGELTPYAAKIYM